MILHFILATAGHVDHGKSALVKTLTGTDPDRLPEEKARGITIDLGFAHIELTSPSNPNLQFLIGIVDVPGHEDFVKNMVAGVGSIDLALFVVAADDGWMPQTEEHLQILTYLGVQNALIALTKIDLLENNPSREQQAISTLRRQLASTPFANSPIIPTSVLSERGIPELKTTLSTLLSQIPPPRDIAKPRLPIDRVFTLRGIGRVLTGTLNGGTLQRSQSVIIQPTGKLTRIRSLQSHNREVELSPPGTRTGLNLPDIAATPEGGDAVARGHVLTLPELGGPSNTLDVVIEKSPRLADSQTAAARPLKDGSLVRIHHGSGHVAARVVLLSHQNTLPPGQRALAQLRCEQPVFAFAGDHFIVRDWAEQFTLAGGIILDPDATRKHVKTETHRRYLQTRAQAPHQPEAFVLSQITRDAATPKTGLLLKSRFSNAQTQDAITTLIRHGKVVLAGDWIVDPASWQQLKQKAANAIDTEHKNHPQLPGLPLNELRRLLTPLLRSPSLFEPLLAELCQSDFEQTHTALRRKSHHPTLPPQLQSASAHVRAALTAKPVEPPSRKEIAPDPLTQQALRFLIQTGQAVELGPEVVLLTENYSLAADRVRQYLQTHGPATVSQLRQAIGASRRIVVPLLERLDREGITRREGDKRFLREHNPYSSC